MVGARQVQPRPLAAVVAAAAVSLLSATPRVGADDDAPLVDSKEYKLVLRVDRFADRPRGVDEFWSSVRAVAEGIPLQVNDSDEEPEQRQVRFLDTTDFQLRDNYQYLFRERIELKDDESRKKQKKITLKYRGTSIEQAKSRNMTAAEGKKKDREEKLEEDVIPPLERKFSKSGETKVKTKREFGKVRDIAACFPGLAALPIQDEDVHVVNNFQGHELKIDVGRIELTKHHEAQASFTFWYDQTSQGELLVAEFSYAYELDKGHAADRQKANCRADELFQAIQEQLREWIDVSDRTKTDVAYRYRRQGDCP